MTNWAQALYLLHPTYLFLYATVRPKNMCEYLYSLPSQVKGNLQGLRDVLQKNDITSSPMLVLNIDGAKQ